MNNTYKMEFIVSWSEIHRDSKALAWRLKNKANDLKGLIAVTRGGLVPAAIIARELDLKFIDTVCISSYDHMEIKESKIIKSLDHDGEGFLIIDDLVDTGRTAKIVREMLPKAHFATVYAKPDGIEFVDTFITEVSQDTWIRFPWDTELNFVKPIANREKD